MIAFFHDLGPALAAEALKVRRTLALLLAFVAPTLIAALNFLIYWQRVEIQAQIPADLAAVRADGERLRQVVANLLRNAVRYTPPGGIVVVAAARETGQDAGCVRIDVRDTGPGIATADLPYIWDRFYRGTGAAVETIRSAEDGAPGGAAAGGERGHDGAGLGLALVKELTEAMGGYVAVESAPGLGSCFSIWLPVSS
jgi:two-component system, OmpR family, sensor kinase